MVRAGHGNLTDISSYIRYIIDQDLQMEVAHEQLRSQYLCVQVSSFGSFGGKVDLREENDANMEAMLLDS